MVQTNSFLLPWHLHQIVINWCNESRKWNGKKYTIEINMMTEGAFKGKLRNVRKAYVIEILFKIYSSFYSNFNDIANSFSLIHLRELEPQCYWNEILTQKPDWQQSDDTSVLKLALVIVRSGSFPFLTSVKLLQLHYWALIHCKAYFLHIFQCWVRYCSQFYT